jgi:hypothetical protein
MNADRLLISAASATTIAGSITSIAATPAGLVPFLFVRCNRKIPIRTCCALGDFGRGDGTVDDGGDLQGPMGQSIWGH